MARYDSTDTEELGQYPTQAFHLFGLPEQNFGSGSPGGSPQSSLTDQGTTNEPGQYPAKETFTGVPLDGTGAPGSAGVPYDGAGGPDSVVYSRPTFYKGMREDGQGFSQSNGTGYEQETVPGAVSGTADWTQANPHSYGDGYDMPGVQGNTPQPGSGRYTTDGQNGSGHVLYGGWLKGQRPGTHSHVAGSGPGT